MDGGNSNDGDGGSTCCNDGDGGVAAAEENSDNSGNDSIVDFNETRGRVA